MRTLIMQMFQNKLKLSITIFSVASAFLITGCNISKQVGAAKAFTECQFRIKSIEQVVLGKERGNFVGARPYSEISTFEMVKNFMGSDPYWLMFQIKIEARNPNAIEASLNRLEWIMLLQDKEMVRGIVKEKIRIPPGPVSITDFNVNVELNAREILSGDTVKGLARIVATLTGFSEEDDRSLLIRVKPTLEIAGMDYTVADYIDVRAKFSADQGKALRQSVIGL